MASNLVGRLRGDRSQGRWLLIGQVLSSGSNFALTMAVLRATDAAGFGAFSLVQVCYQLILVIARSAIAEPILATAEARRLARNLPQLMGGLGLVVGLTLLPATVFLSDGLRQVATIFIVALPFLLAQEGYRQERICTHDARQVVALELLWILGMSVALAGAVLVTGLTLDPALATTGWAAGAVLSVAWGLGSRSGSARVPVKETWTAVRRSLRDLLVVAVLMRGARQASTIALGTVLGLSEFGVLRAAISVMTPTNVILQAARSRAFQVGQTTKGATRKIYGSIAVLCLVWFVGAVLLALFSAGVAAKVPALTLAIVGASFLVRIGVASAEVTLRINEQYADLRRAVVRTLPFVLGLPVLGAVVGGRNWAAAALVVNAGLTWLVMARAADGTARRVQSGLPA